MGSKNCRAREGQAHGASGPGDPVQPLVERGSGPGGWTAPREGEQIKYFQHDC